MMTSTIAPAPVAKKRNTFSWPNRRRDASPPPPPSGGGPATASPAETAVAVSAGSATGGWVMDVSGDAGHGAGDLGTDLVGQRSVADLGCRGLPVGAGRVGQERLDQGERRGRGALPADDLVRDQHDRVRPGR